jgi:ribosomal protein S18 acetylase RimI-like enzyme
MANYTRLSSLSCSRPSAGVIEISYIAAKETLKLLEPGTDAFCYIASMVVAPAWRRRGGAAALLAAAEAAAAAWEERQTLLHVHQDNLPAIQLYERFGYEVIHQTNNTFAGLGPKPRYLMRKRW